MEKSEIDKNEELQALGHMFSIEMITAAERGQMELEPTQLAKLLGINEGGDIKSPMGPDALRIAKKISGIDGFERLDIIATPNGIRIMLCEKETGEAFVVNVESLR